jgi:hypothetical protein
MVYVTNLDQYPIVDGVSQLPGEAEKGTGFGQRQRPLQDCVWEAGTVIKHPASHLFKGLGKLAGFIFYHRGPHFEEALRTPQM